MTQNKITIIGSGAMGTAMAKVLYDSGNHNIMIYGIDKGELEELKQGKNSKYFPEKINLPKFKTTLNLKDALKDSKYVVLVIPSKFMDKIMSQILENISSKVLLINASKGFYPQTTQALHTGIKTVTADNELIRGVVSLIGPSHAEEIVQETPTIIDVVDQDVKLCQEVKRLFSTKYFKTYIQTDVIGAEVGAAYKNVLAIASGMSSGLGYGINTLAALLTRGLAEMRRFNEKMGGKTETIIGLTGIGDLIVTATSDLSRNFTFGKQFALKGKEALKTKKTVEGLTALKIIYDISKKENLYLPIVDYIYNVLFSDYKLDGIVVSLWDGKNEFEN